MKIEKAQFAAWKADAVTKEIFASLVAIRENINRNLVDGNVVMGDPKHAIRLLGQREGLDVLLQIEAADVAEEQEEEESLIQTSP
jgi:hypothetical protein